MTFRYMPKDSVEVAEINPLNPEVTSSRTAKQYLKSKVVSAEGTHPWIH